LKAYVLAPYEGVYNFGPADALIAFAKAQNISIRGNSLVYDASTPDWFFAGNSSNITAYQTLVKQRLARYITDVVTHFKGSVHRWDVVNEVVSNSPSTLYANTRFYEILGPSYIPYVFQLAHAADPTAKLFMNDYGTDDPGKISRLLSIAKSLRQAGIYITGVGHETHIAVNAPVLANIDASMTAVEQAGFKNMVSELDMSIYSDPPACGWNTSYCLPSIIPGVTNVTGTLLLQAERYEALFKIFMKHSSSLDLVAFWGVMDAFTWLNYFPVQRINYPLLFDIHGNPKAAFYKVANL
jgi:endo-1,4-beta-xylanase